MTPRIAIGSLILAACSAGREPEPHAALDPPAPVPLPDQIAPETSLGVADTGIWSDLDPQVQLTLPADLKNVTAVAVGDTLVLYADGWPVKAYPYADATLRPGDAAELDGILGDVTRADAPPPGDRDGDGLPDPLDVLIGAKKTALAASPYGGGYRELDYPGGDLPRDEGVCTDVVIRALRNAGLDLQKEVHEDIRRSKKSYPMVKGKGNASIDHRRVKTILPWFKRHADPHTAELDDAADPYRPGDIVFFDTFPSKTGPDHIGVVSDTIGDSGHLLVINSWTDGFVTQEMDLLGWVPVTHRFRL